MHVGYNQIQVRWTEAMVETLFYLFDKHDTALFDDPQCVWETLGVTVYAAKMKAARLGLVREPVFSDEPAERHLSYSYIYFDGYHTAQEVAGVATDLEQRVRIDCEGFSSPRHKQGFHVQVPVVYKGIAIEQYTAEEREFIQILATYLANPGTFQQKKDYAGLPCFRAP